MHIHHGGGPPAPSVREMTLDEMGIAPEHQAAWVEQTEAWKQKMAELTRSMYRTSTGQEGDTHES